MIEQRARVVALEGEVAVVEVAAAGGCGACAVNQGCAASKLGRLVRSRHKCGRLRNAVSARVGDEVVLGVAEEALLASALTAYLPPLLGLLAGAAIAAGLGSGEFWPAVGAGFGLALGLAASALLGRSRAQRHAPRLLRCAAPPPVTIEFRRPAFFKGSKT